MVRQTKDFERQKKAQKSFEPGTLPAKTAINLIMRNLTA
jgi:hypothetical protein